MRGRGQDLARVAAVLGALAHPVRLHILTAAGEERLSPQGLATGELSEHSLATIAYHVRQLAAAGLLLPDGEEPRRGSVEHYYRRSKEATDLLARLGLSD